MDSGEYSLNGTKLLIDSKIENNEKGLKAAYFHMQEIKIKRYQYLFGFTPKHKVKTLFGKKYLVLSFENFNYSQIISKRPKDRIETDTLSSQTSLKSWISKKILPRYGYGENGIEFPDSSWNNLLKNEKIEIILITNSSDLFEVFYLINNYLYTSSLYKQLNGQKAILNKLMKENYITRKERRYLTAYIEKSI